MKGVHKKIGIEKKRTANEEWSKAGNFMEEGKTLKGSTEVRKWNSQIEMRL